MHDIVLINKIAIVAITKHGIDIAEKIKSQLHDAKVFVPDKHKLYYEEKKNNGKSMISDINWFSEQTSKFIPELFKTFDALVCIFSLGAVIRLIAPVLSDKKNDPAVLVIDDQHQFVISALSGHLGGANELTKTVAEILNSIPVITTAADVNNTISVDLLGKDLGWIIDDFSNVTAISAHMVNEEKIAVFQSTGQTNWWQKEKKMLPKNVFVVHDIDDLKKSEFKGCLIISDQIIYDEEILKKSVIYRPKSLVVGVGLHWDTSMDVIENGITEVFDKYKLSLKSINKITSLDRGTPVRGLSEFCQKYGLELKLFGKAELSGVQVPNPSDVVKKYEGTPSVSEASCILGSVNGSLIVTKQIFPPNLTIAICRTEFE